MQSAEAVTRPVQEKPGYASGWVIQLPGTSYAIQSSGTETLVLGGLIVDLPGGYNVFSLVLDEFQLPANVPAPPSSGDPWVVTASAAGGRRRHPVLLPPPVYAVSSSKFDRTQRGNKIFEIDRQ